jgi:hypothetical protein
MVSKPGCSLFLFDPTSRRTNAVVDILKSIPPSCIYSSTTAETCPHLPPKSLQVATFSLTCILSKEGQTAKATKFHSRNPVGEVVIQRTLLPSPFSLKKAADFHIIAFQSWLWSQLSPVLVLEVPWSFVVRYPVFSNLPGRKPIRLFPPASGEARDNSHAVASESRKRSLKVENLRMFQASS